jgi:endonuclease/exonuclease/phosphatase family metal-dependent hydrolase
MNERLRIATFNLESLDDRPDLDVPLDARIDVLRPQLMRLRADVLCLQEVNAQRSIVDGPRVLHALDRLLEGTSYEGYRRFAAGGSGDPHQLANVHNLVILSRFPIVAAFALRHKLVEPPRYRPTTADPRAEAAEAVEWDRPILAAEIDLPDGRRLHVINLHLRAPLAAPVAGQKRDAFVWNTVAGWAEGYYLATIKRAGQALEARLLVEQIFDRKSDALVAVLGDFNAEAREPPVSILCAEVEDTGNGLLARRVLIPVERALPDSQRFSVVHHGRKAMLDHVLISQTLLADFRHIEVHNESVGDELVGYALVQQGTVSYHAPLVAEFAQSSSAQAETISPAR